MSDLARLLRRDVLEISYRTRTGHIGSCFSALDLLTVLYFEYLKVDPLHPADPDRDRFVLSKGHASAALYCCLARRGFISERRLAEFACDGGSLRHHPDREPSVGIEASTGSLGHGLSLAAGIALGGQVAGRVFRTVVMLSDGDLNEGSTWEGAMFAGHHRLQRLVAIVDANGLQALGRSGEVLGYADLGAAWRGLGWNVFEIDGHDLDQIRTTLAGIPALNGRPSVILAKTVKGKGVSFMEDDLLWHYRCPDEREFELALRELV